MRTDAKWIALIAVLFAIGGCQQSTTPPEEAAVDTESEAVSEPEAAVADATAEDESSPPPMRNFARLGMPRGLLNKTDAATPGYVMFTPLKASETYLVDTDGEVVHIWESEFGPSGWVYLKENGNLLRGGRDPEAPVFAGGGQGGWFQELTWEGEVVWQYRYTSEQSLTHHDVAVTPEGTFLAIAWEAKTPAEAIALGRDPESIPKAGLWPDTIVELKPKGTDDAEIIWKWRMWDHVIQDFDESKANFGVIADHPGLLDINLSGEPPGRTQEEMDQRFKIGFASTNDTVDNQGSDMYHFNAINYNAELDQIVFSAPDLGEIFIIDHSTTTEEAAGHTGGRWGKGGDILWRWGNPANYDRGDESDQMLSGQHDVQWIPTGHPGAGELLVFNNDVPGADPAYSAVYQLATPLTETGYAAHEDGTFGPAEPSWRLVPDNPDDIYSPFISGAQRLPNGNTFVAEGASGRFFEVDYEGNELWNYMTPYAGDVIYEDGTTPQPVGPFVYATFRATHIPVDHPAVAGRELQPLEPQPPAYEPPAM